MSYTKIDWIIEILNFEVEDNFQVKFDDTLKDKKQIMNFTKLDIILIPFNKSFSFRDTLKKRISYFLNPMHLNTVDINKDAFALHVPDNFLKDRDLCLIAAKVYKYMSVSILHELYHKLFENNSFKRVFMPKSYLKEGTLFISYLEEFFVEFLAIQSNSTEIFSDKSNIDEFLILLELQCSN